MARYSKTDRACGLTVSVCRILDTLENVLGVEIQARGAQKGLRRVQIPMGAKPSRLELVVHDERAQCIVVTTPKVGAVRRILSKRLLKEGVTITA